MTTAPGSRALGDDDRALILLAISVTERGIAVSERAAAAALSGAAGTRLYVGMQLAGLTTTLEKLLAKIPTAAEAFEAGWRAREVSTGQAEAKPELRVVAN